uniref:Alternative protein RIMS1 n=1 Tax=Homo sapiens TaxID=9606 RepID=L8ECF5_HUMAN|nr:alternative protein RIMS1 [Homo sapiens]
MMNRIGINFRHMMSLHYLCLSHHLSCQGDIFMEKALAKSYKDLSESVIVTSQIMRLMMVLA